MSWWSAHSDCCCTLSICLLCRRQDEPVCWVLRAVCFRLKMTVNMSCNKKTSLCAVYSSGSWSCRHDDALVALQWTLNECKPPRLWLKSRNQHYIAVVKTKPVSTLEKPLESLWYFSLLGGQAGVANAWSEPNGSPMRKDVGGWKTAFLGPNGRNGFGL